MNVILTGGAGFIGSAFLWKLNQEGISNILVVDHLGQSDKWKNLCGKKFLDYLEKDKFQELLSANKISAQFDLVVHLGACTSTTETDGSYIISNNTFFSQELAKWSIEKNIKFMYASSAATYGQGESGFSDDDKTSINLRPLNVYGFSKYLFDLWVLNHHYEKKITGFKYFNVFGPNEYHKADMKSVIAKSFHQVKNEGKIRLFESYKSDYKHGEQKRDFVYIKDVVEMMYHFVENPRLSGIFNVGSGKARTWNELANAIFQSINSKPCIEYIEMPGSIKDKYQYFTQADLTKLRKAGCQHQCMSLENSVVDYVKYLQNNLYL